MIRLNSSQIKGRIKEISRKTGADPRLLLRLFAMERFLERVSISKYRDKFIIKGGVLVVSMVGVSLRSTMDIDTSLRNENLSEDGVRKMICEISNKDIGDGAKLSLERVWQIMDEMEYPGVRASMNVEIDGLKIPFHIDISTGDAITPEAINFSYKTLLYDSSINLLAYNIETVLAEKLQTILSRGLENTRMRDFYDVTILLEERRDTINAAIFNKAFQSTCSKKHTEFLKDGGLARLQSIEKSEDLKGLWDAYRNKYAYASDYSFDDVIKRVKSLWQMTQN